MVFFTAEDFLPAFQRDIAPAITVCFVLPVHGFHEQVDLIGSLVGFGPGNISIVSGYDERKPHHLGTRGIVVTCFDTNVIKIAGEFG